MNQPKYTLKDIENILSQVLPNTPVKKAILFGSYAKGYANDQSDIDLVIDSHGAIKGLRFFGVAGTISDAFSVPVDVIELSQIISGSPVDQEVNKTGVLIYGK